MIKIMPSILGQENKAKLVDKAIKLGLDTIHYDVMDGNLLKTSQCRLPRSRISFQNQMSTKHQYI